MSGGAVALPRNRFLPPWAITPVLCRSSSSLAQPEHPISSWRAAPRCRSMLRPGHDAAEQSQQWPTEALPRQRGRSHGSMYSAGVPLQVECPPLHPLIASIVTPTGATSRYFDGGAASSRRNDAVAGLLSDTTRVHPASPAPTGLATTRCLASRRWPGSSALPCCAWRPGGNGDLHPHEGAG